MKKDEELLEHIKNRELYSEPFFYIGSILKYAGMENYGPLCIDRIAEAWLIDGNHIMLDLLGERLGDVIVDNIGFRKCSHILKSYIPDNKYDTFMDYIDTHSLGNRLKNDTIEQLHCWDKSQIHRIMEESKKNLDDETGERVCKQLIEELKSRGIRGKIRRWKLPRLSAIGTSLKIKRMSRKYKGIVQKAIENTSLEKQHEVKISNSDRRRCLSENKWIIYLEAFERFVEGHGGAINVNDLTREENLKFAYLGVNRYGKFYNDIRKWKDRTPVSVKNEYAALSNVLESVSRLTPSELQQMFPIEKKYDGDKYGEKDYFYTLKRLSKMNQDKPIYACGNIESLLWDYANMHITTFAVHYLGNLGDQRTYLNDDSKDEEFFKKLEYGCRE